MPFPQIHLNLPTANASPLEVRKSRREISPANFFLTAGRIDDMIWVDSMEQKGKIRCQALFNPRLPDQVQRG